MNNYLPLGVRFVVKVQLYLTQNILDSYATVIFEMTGYPYRSVFSAYMFLFVFLLVVFINSFNH